MQCIEKILKHRNYGALIYITLTVTSFIIFSISSGFGGSVPLVKHAAVPKLTADFNHSKISQLFDNANK